MLDITKAKKVFKEYIKKYDPTNGKIAIKIAHMYRVAEIAKNTAKYLRLSDEDVRLAELIGLLHDIGRFEQIKQFNTFDDKKSINHGELGIKILFQDNLIRKFIEDTCYDRIIYLAIINHNKNQSLLTKDVTKRERLHMNIIRDSDTLDILNIIIDDNADKKALYDKEDLTDETLSDEIYNEFMKVRELDYGKIKNSADLLITRYMFIWNMNYNYALQEIKNRQYLEKLYNKFMYKDQKTMDRITEIYDMTSRYMNKKLLEAVPNIGRDIYDKFRKMQRGVHKVHQTI